MSEIVNYSSTKILDFAIYNKRSDVHVELTGAFGAVYFETDFLNCETEKVYSLTNTV